MPLLNPHHLVPDHFVGSISQKTLHNSLVSPLCSQMQRSVSILQCQTITLPNQSITNNSHLVCCVLYWRKTRPSIHCNLLYNSGGKDTSAWVYCLVVANILKNHRSEDANNLICLWNLLLLQGRRDVQEQLRCGDTRMLHLRP